MDDRWEQGSEFSLVEHGAGGSPDLPSGVGRYGCGRDALRALLRHGAETLGWKAVWAPSYFCQTVLRDVKAEGVEVRSYPDGPLDPSDAPIEIPGNEPGAVLTLNPFGLRARARPVVARAGRWIVEDHSHDPWSPLVAASEADAGLVSLRKTVPIPDGGLLWSPRGHALPPAPEPTAVRTGASQEKLAGMALKSRYLAGGDVEKETFRRFQTSGEARIASGPVSGMPHHTRALLDAFPAGAWRERRRENHARLAGRLRGLDGLRVLEPEDASCAPFMGVVVCATAELREALRRGLVQARVYPAVLWSLEGPEVDGIREIDLDLSRRSLAIHCDGRYGAADMDRVGEAVAS